MENIKCEVCGRMREVRVCASTLGPMSCCYCRSCLQWGVEPFYMTVYRFGGLVPFEITEDSWKFLAFCLVASGNTIEEFLKEQARGVRK